MALDAFGPPRYAWRHERDAQQLPDPRQQRTRVVDPTWVWRVPFAPLSMAETVTAIGNLIEMGRPTFFITANTHYVMLTQQNPDLQVINAQGGLHPRRRGPVGLGLALVGIAATGASCRFRPGLRVECGGGQAGIPFVLRGGAEGVAEQAALRLRELYPGLQVVGTECPSLHKLTREEEAALIGRIRAPGPTSSWSRSDNPRASGGSISTLRNSECRSAFRSEHPSTLPPGESRRARAGCGNQAWNGRSGSGSNPGGSSGACPQRLVYRSHGRPGSATGDRPETHTPLVLGRLYPRSKTA